MNKDQVKGRAKEAIGAIKAATGKVIGGKDMESKGSVQKATGKIQAGYGDLKKDIKRK